MAVIETNRSEGFFEQALRWRERQYATLAELCLMAVGDDDIEHLLGTAADRLRYALDADFTKVLDQRAGATGLFLRAGAGWPDGVVGEREVPDGYQSQGGYTLERDAPVMVRDMLSETRFEPPDLLLEHGVRSAVSVVMRGEGRVVGVLQADKCRPGYFQSDAIPVLQAYADVLGAAIAAAERAAISSSFASLAAHELRTPLTVIVGHVDRVLGPNGPTAELTSDVRESLLQIQHESRRLQRTIQLFLALGDIERRKLPERTRTVDPLVPVDAAVEAVAEGYPDRRLKLDVSDHISSIEVDETALSHVVTNLLDNAAKYSPPGSLIVASLSPGPLGPRIEVVDACGGMSEAELRRVFEWSFRGEEGVGSRQRGLGMGLYVAHRLSERLGWSLTVENRDGGCVFVLELVRTSDAS